MEKYLRMNKKILKRENGKGFFFWHIKLYAFHLYTYVNYFLIKLENNDRMSIHSKNLALIQKWKNKSVESNSLEKYPNTHDNGILV